MILSWPAVVLQMEPKGSHVIRNHWIHLRSWAEVISHPPSSNSLPMFIESNNFPSTMCLWDSHANLCCLAEQVLQPNVNPGESAYSIQPVCICHYFVCTDMHYSIWEARNKYTCLIFFLMSAMIKTFPGIGSGKSLKYVIHVYQQNV